MYESVINEIQLIINTWYEKLLNLDQKILKGNKNEQNRTIKQILGHLTDSAANNHHRITRLQYTANLEFPDYRQHNDLWIKIQNFQNEDWQNMLAFWKYYNIHLIHIIKNIDAESLSNTWTDFEGTVETLDSIVICQLLFHAGPTRFK